jgi:hypothetical protein
VNQKKITFFVILAALTLFFVLKPEYFSSPRPADPSLASEIPGSPPIAFSSEQNTPEQPLSDLPSSENATNAADTVASDMDLDCLLRMGRQLYSTNEFIEKNKSVIDRIVGVWFYRKSSDSKNIPAEKSRQGKFFLALAKAGLLGGMEEINPDFPKDEEEALRLLKEVSTEDPANSAPLIYLAWIYQKRGQTDISKKYIRQAESSSKFDSYITDFTTAVFSSVDTTEDFMMALSLWSKSPIPDYNAIVQMLIENKSEKIATQMVARGLNDKNNFTDINWLPIEYAVGKKILTKMGKADHLPKYQDLLKTKKNILDGDLTLSQMAVTCDIRELESSLKMIREHFRSTQ